MWYYQSIRDDSEVREKLTELAEKHPTRGFDTYFGRIRLQGYVWNRKRVLRVYRVMKLGLRRKYKKRLIVPVQDPLEVPDTPNHTWSVDFMSDALSDGRKIRVLNITDDYNREALSIEVGLSFTSERVIRVFEVLEEEFGLPANLRLDNGPEFTANRFKLWCEEKQINLKYIQPGKPVQNAYIERFNRIFREDILDAYWFEDLEQLRILVHNWREDYNYHHPHKSLGGIPPRTYYKNAVNSGKVIERIPAPDFTTMNSLITMKT
jgi:putative transposase